MIILFILFVIYGAVVIGDVIITTKAVRLGLAKEVNTLLAPIVDKPMFIRLKLILYAVFVVMIAFLHRFMSGLAITLIVLAIVWRLFIFVDNIAIVRTRQEKQEKVVRTRQEKDE